MAESEKKLPGHRSPPRPDPMSALLRQERAVRRLPPGAACAECGETDPVLLELHHLAGRANDEELVVVLCLNHHRRQSVNQTAVGVDLAAGQERSVPDRVVALLRGMALMFNSLAQGCGQMADRLTAFIAGLD